MSSKIADQVTYIQAHRNLTNEELGALLGVSAETLRRWRNGDSIPSRRHWAALDALYAKVVTENE